MNSNKKPPRTISIADRIRAEQIGTRYAGIPATTIAQTCGGVFLVWVLWDAVDRVALLVGASLLASVLAAGLALFLLYRRATADLRLNGAWGKAIIVTSFCSGCLWGSAVIFIYPPLDPDYLVFLVLLLAILPFVPVAAFAGYLPAFYAYYIPCATPFTIYLALQGDRAGISTAILFLMLITAAMVYAKNYNRNLSESERLRLLVQQQKDALEQANAAKSTFLAATSHDLRQPLHAITLLIDALKPRTADQYSKEIQQQLAASAEALHDLLDSILDISKLDAGIVPVNKQSFYIASMLQQLAVEFLPDAGAKGLRLSVVPTSAIIHTDPVLLERVVRNLIDNAIRYTQDGGVVIGCRRRGEEYVLQVVDSGIGIADQHKDEIFDEFTQLANSERDRRKGLGLGLAIVKRLLELLQLPFLVSSVAGRGSVFSIHLSRGSINDLVTEKSVDRKIDTQLQDALLLVIDDEADIRMAMVKLGSTWGCQVLAAATAEKGLTQTRSAGRMPDVLIVDYRLQDGSTGLDAVNYLQEQLEATIPVIIVTGDTASEPLQAASAAGHTLLHKPLKPGQLKAVLTQTILKNGELHKVSSGL